MQMPTRTIEIPSIVLERIESTHPSPALFAADETDEWPPGVLLSLVERSLLRETARSKAITCPGCEWQCHKNVVVRKPSERAQKWAFITCNEEPDLGRISVLPESLTQYAATLPSIAAFIAGALQLGSPRPSSSGSSYLLGQVKGRRGPRPVSVTVFDSRLFLVVGQQQELLIRVLRWSASGLSINLEHVQRLANRKEHAHAVTNTSYQPDRTRQKARSRQKRKRDAEIFREAKRLRAASGGSWTLIASEIAATALAGSGQEKRLTAGTVRRIITDMHKLEREFSHSKRKSRK